MDVHDDLIPGWFGFILLLLILFIGVVGLIRYAETHQEPATVHQVVSEQ